MLLPASMRRVEIIVPLKKFEEVMLYLREQNAIELLDVKEMIKGYGGGVTSNPVSDRLYRLTTLESKISSLANTLGLALVHVKPVDVDARVSDEQVAEIEAEVNQIEQRTASITNELQVLEALVTYAERQLEESVEEILKIKNVDSPEGRSRLEEIVASIYQTLKPSEVTVAGPLAQLIQQKAVEDTIVKDISDQVVRTLESKHAQTAVAETITHSLGLRLRAVLRSKRLAYEATSRIEEAKQRIKELKGKLAEINKANGEYLLIQREIIAAEKSFEQAKAYCGKTETTCMIEGWITSSMISRVSRDLKQICNDEVIIKNWFSKDAPTKLQNPKGPIMSIFEKLTVGFGIPRSDEVDPSILWLITYPLFFGFMFGDVGNGLVVMIFSAIFYVYKRRGLVIPDNAFGGLGGVFNMVIQGSPLLILSGFSAVVVGFLYGTVFGNVEWFTQLTGLPGPLWFEPFENIRLMLRLSITIGVLHIMSGLLIDVINKARAREYRELIAGPLVWMWFYGAFGFTLLQYGLRFPNYLFNPANTMDIFLRIGVPLIAMLVLKLYTEGAMGLMHAFENLLSSLSHTISYVRILAMKLIDDVFLRLFLGVLAFFLAWGSLAGNALGWILFSALTTVLILILETAFVFMQSLRLHWVEWFMKFFQGGGRAFQPYGAERVYTRVRTGGISTS